MTISSALQLPANALTAFAFFIARGLSPAQSAGLVGNFMQESQMDPNSVNQSEGAVGIANWEGGRRTALETYANSMGQPSNSLQAQLWFAWNELNTSESASLQSLKQTSTPAAAASVVANQYERCGNCVLTNRINYANAVFQGGTGQTPPIGSSAIANATGGNAGSANAQTTSDVNSDCQFKINYPSLGPIGGGTGCYWYKGWSRAALGGLLLVGGSVVLITGVVILSGKDVTPAAPIMKLNKGLTEKRQRSIDINKRIAGGSTKFPDRPPKFAGRSLRSGRFTPKGVFE